MIMVVGGVLALEGPQPAGQSETSVSAGPSSVMLRRATSSAKGGGGVVDDGGVEASGAPGESDVVESEAEANRWQVQVAGGGRRGNNNTQPVAVRVANTQG